MPKQSGLTPQERQFVAEYIRNEHNATAAARAVGHKGPRPDCKGYAILHRLHVQDEIRRQEAALLDQAGVNSFRVLREQARIAFADIRRAFDECGSLKNPHQWDDSTAAAVLERSFDREGNPQLKMHAKQAALDALMKHLRLAGPDRLELTGKDGGPINIKADDLTDNQLAAIIAAEAGGSEES